MQGEAGDEQVENRPLDENLAVEEAGADGPHHRLHAQPQHVRLLRQGALLVEVANDEVDGRQADAAVVEDAPPEGVVEVGAAHAGAHLQQQLVGALEDVRALLVAGEDADEEAVEGGLEAVGEGEQPPLVQLEDGRADVDGGVGEQREEAVGEDGQLGEEALLADGVEHRVVRLQGLQVDARGQEGVHALRQALPHDEPPRNVLVADIAVQYLIGQ